MKKLHLILLSLVAAVPGGYLCYLLGTALALPRSDLWKKPLLGGAVVGTGLLVLGLAVVWPLLYAIAFYDDPNKKKAGEGEDEELAADEAGELEEDKPKTPRGDSFEDEDVDVFEREGVTADSEDEEVEDLEQASAGSEFDLEEESIEQAETAEFELDPDDLEEMELDEDEEEEAPKKKAKKKKK